KQQQLQQQPGLHQPAPSPQLGQPRTVLVTKSTSSVSGGGLKIEERTAIDDACSTISSAKSSSPSSGRSCGSDDSGRGSRVREENPYAALTADDYFAAHAPGARHPQPPRMKPPPPPQEDPYYLFRRALPAQPAPESHYGVYGRQTTLKEADYGKTSHYGTTGDYGRAGKTKPVKEENPYGIYEGFKRMVRRDNKYKDDEDPYAMYLRGEDEVKREPRMEQLKETIKSFNVAMFGGRRKERDKASGSTSSAGTGYVPGKETKYAGSSRRGADEEEDFAKSATAKRRPYWEEDAAASGTMSSTSSGASRASSGASAASAPAARPPPPDIQMRQKSPTKSTSSGRNTWGVSSGGGSPFARGGGERHSVSDFFGDRRSPRSAGKDGKEGGGTLMMFVSKRLGKGKKREQMQEEAPSEADSAYARQVAAMNKEALLNALIPVL
ncbi:hypothetical protein PFISCL1PPCAC_8579, partial [Pristionchus fissidentatus]